MINQPKDIVPMEEHIKVIYYIPCIKYPSVCVGQTRRCLKQRANGHHHAPKKGDIRIHSGRVRVQDWSHSTSDWTSSNQRCYIDQNLHTTTPHVGELVYPTQPGSLEHGERNLNATNHRNQHYQANFCQHCSS